MMNSEATAEPASASTGRIAPFGKYLLLQRVSVGGMAEIFKALPQNATRIDEIVAIKRILPNIAEDSEFIGMFIDEARIAGELNHPNICRIFELGRVNNDHYIAMQFLWGRDLLKVMNRYKKAGRFVSPSFAAWVSARACAALHYAHTKRDEHGRPLHIIHRDVSPQNIIIGYSGQVKLIDFGVARAASQSQRTQAGILKGKFGYMSPEMIRGMPVDHRSDVFAMGICMHELLTSARLFYGETDFATLELVRDAKVHPPSRRSPAVPPALDAIVMRALSRDPDERYQSAAEMEQALLDFMASHDPLYGESDVGLAMRQAFQVEVQRERDRLEIFWSMLERGELVRGAAIPSTPPPSHESGPRSAMPKAAALIEPPPASESDDDELADQQTQIFFSATELDELRELDARQSAPPSTLSDMIPPAPTAELAGTPPHAAFPQRTGTLPPRAPGTLPPRPAGLHGTLPPPAFDARRPGTLPPGTGSARQRPSGTVPPVPPGSRSVPGTFPPPPSSQRHVPTLRPGAHPVDGLDAIQPAFQPPAEPVAQTRSPFDPPAYDAPVAKSARTFDELPYGAHEQRPERKPNKGLRYAVLALLALTVMFAAYAIPRFANAGTGALAIESVGDTDALVRVDGVVRGNPPLVVEGLPPGIHRVEVEASGFEIARADVNVEKGQSRNVKLALEKLTPEPQLGAAVAPAQQAPQITPLPVEPAKPAVAPKPAKRAPVVAKPDDDESERVEPEEQPNAAAPAAEPTLPESEANEDAPTVAATPGNETQTGEDLNEELASTNEGELLISTVPWSHVFVDDQDTGRDTPVRSLRVPAGAHRIGLRTPDDVMHQVDVVVEPGKVVRIIRRF
jgi:eukaryotic-like serine/threonine-protein kinase